MAGFDRVILRPITDDLIDGQLVARTHVAPFGAPFVDSVAPVLTADEHLIYISAALALIVGLAFGCYPALRAARLAPIDAIHTE